MKRQLRHVLRNFGYDLVGFNLYKGKPNPERPWEEDDAFLRLCDRVSSHTLLDRRRLHLLYQFARNAARIGGNYAECGVYRGGTALLLALTKPAERKLFLFDTFEGMPEADAERDHHVAGDLGGTSLEQVQQLLTGHENVLLRKGFFPETAKGLEEERFAFVHCDMDIYRSVLACCAFFYPRLRNGGTLLFDDFGFRSCPGAKKAVLEFCEASDASFIYLPTGQALIIRVPSSTHDF